MADEIYTEVEEQKEYAKHPTGQYFARCVDVIDLGERVASSLGKPDKLQRRVAFVFRTGQTNPENGFPMDISKEFALSMFKQTADSQAPLRRFLEQWRGEPYKNDEEASNVPLHKCVNRVAVLQITHEPWKNDPSKASANISTATPVGINPSTGERLTVPEFSPYTRSEYWAKRKAKFATAAAEFRQRIGAPSKQKADDGFADDSSLPF